MKTFYKLPLAVRRMSDHGGHGKPFRSPGRLPAFPIMQLSRSGSFHRAVKHSAASPKNETAIRNACSHRLFSVGVCVAIDSIKKSHRVAPVGEGGDRSAFRFYQPFSELNARLPDALSYTL